MKAKNKSRKKLCSSFDSIDSFDMFKNKEGILWVKNSPDPILLQIYRYNLVARLYQNDCITVQYDGGAYAIPIEKMRCNFGGYYHFFRCPTCDRRMRKLYLIEGKYLCRKCCSLGYHTQRLAPSQRLLYAQVKVKNKLTEKAGTITKRPPRMRRHTFHRLRKRYIDYDQQHFSATNNQLIKKYGEQALFFVEDDYAVTLSSEFHDVYDYT